MREKKVATREVAQRVLDLLSFGLCRSLGIPKPGKMCVEAAVCYALGQEHGDSPDCVHPGVARFKISLNDLFWSSNIKRAEGLRRVAIAQLGSNHIDGDLFYRTVQDRVAQKYPQYDRRTQSLNHFLIGMATTSVEYDSIYKWVADLAAEVLVEMGTDGAQWMDLVQ